MIKLIGALCILFATTALGFAQAAQFAKRPQQIRVLIQALQRLETEIVYAFTPLPEALGRIGQSLFTVEKTVAIFFKEASQLLEHRTGFSAQEIWQQSLEKHWSGTAFQQNEREIVLKLGDYLGLSDREDQTKHIRLAMDQLKLEEELAREEQQRYEKMWKSLGVLGGMFVVIVLF